MTIALESLADSRSELTAFQYRPRQIADRDIGQMVLAWRPSHPDRIFYPLQSGFQRQLQMLNELSRQLRRVADLFSVGECLQTALCCHAFQPFAGLALTPIAILSPSGNLVVREGNCYAAGLPLLTLCPVPSDTRPPLPEASLLMKILLLADIHANWPALAAIDETFDVCLFLGDLVEYGADPVPCIDWVRQHVHAAVRGNHDHATSQRVATSGNAGCRRLASVTRQQHQQVLTPGHLKFLARLPVTSTLELDGRSFYLVHATPRDPMDEYLGYDPEAWAARLAGIEADFVCVGHTHVPLDLQIGKTRLINPGSVGQPRDGDPRAAYVVVENGRVEFRRRAYDVERAIQRLREVGLDSESVDIAADMLRSGGRPLDAASSV